MHSDTNSIITIIITLVIIIIIIININITCRKSAQKFWFLVRCNREGKNSQPNVKPMFEALLELMRFDPSTDDIATARRLAKEKVDNFLERFASEKDFCKYFKAQWADKLGTLFTLM